MSCGMTDPAHAHTVKSGHSHEGHSHAGGHDHDHMPSIDTADGRRRVIFAAVLTFGYMGAEIVGALISGSLALLADAAHMLTDSGSLLLAWLGYKLAEKPASDAYTYGFGRFKILAAFTNGIALIALAAWIFYEAVERLMHPSPVLGGIMLVIAAGGLVVNIVAFMILNGGDKDDLNMQGALWHVIGDLLGSVAAIGAAIVILMTNWTPIDPILSVLVAALVAVAGWRIARNSGHILMQGAPGGLSARAIQSDLLKTVPGITGIRRVHVWTLIETQPVVSLELGVERGADTEALRRDVKARIKDMFDVDQTVIEVVSDPANRDQDPA